MIYMDNYIYIDMFIELDPTMQPSFDVERLLSATPERVWGKTRSRETLNKEGVHLSGCPAPSAIPSLTPVEKSPFSQ